MGGGDRRLERVVQPDPGFEGVPAGPGQRREAGGEVQRRVGAGDGVVGRLGPPVVVDRRRAGGHRVRLVELPGQSPAVAVLAAAVGLQGIAQPFRLHELGGPHQRLQIGDLPECRLPGRLVDPPCAQVMPHRAVQRDRPAVFRGDGGLQGLEVGQPFDAELAVQERRPPVVERALPLDALVFPGAVHVVQALWVALDVRQRIAEQPPAGGGGQP